MDVGSHTMEFADTTGSACYCSETFLSRKMLYERIGLGMSSNHTSLLYFQASSLRACLLMS